MVGMVWTDKQQEMRKLISDQIKWCNEKTNKLGEAQRQTVREKFMQTVHCTGRTCSAPIKHDAILIWSRFTHVSILPLMHKAKLFLPLCTRQNGHRDKFRCYRRFHDQGRSRSSDDFENLSDFRSFLMIDLGRETDGNNGICLAIGVHFALCIIKSSTTRSYWALFLGQWSPFVFILYSSP